MPFRNRLSAERSVLRMAVDPISNTVAITAANPAYPPRRAQATPIAPGPWGQALAEGVLSDDLIWPVLHELTHHSSLQTPVGASLGALVVSHTSMVGAVHLDSDRLTGAARDAVRLAAVNPLLRPLLEGMALFAEFDATSGDVPLASWPSQVAGRLFCYPECREAVLAGRDVLSPLKSKLEALRLTPTVIARKKALLRRDLLDPGGYLLGYLLIKTMWADLTMRNRIWENTDLFLMFINDYFFGDHTLAYLLVQPADQPLDDDLGELSVYLYNRVVDLSRKCSEYGKQFAEYYLGLSQAVPQYKNAAEPTEETLRSHLGMRTLRVMHWLTPDFVTTRTIPRVLAAPATVSIDRAGQFEARFHDGTSPVVGPALAAGRPARGEATEGDGSVECVVLLPQHGRKLMRVLLCIFLDKDLVATFDPVTGRFNDPEDAQACDKMASYLAIESFAEQVQDERWVPKGSALAAMLDRYSGEAGTRQMVDLWAQFALMADPDLPVRPSAVPALEKGGLKKALGLDESTFQSVAEISLRPLRSKPISGGPRQAAEHRALLDTVNERSRAVLGFRLIVTSECTLLPSRV